MARFEQAGLYLVTSQLLSAGRMTGDIVKAALAAGVRLIQLREKEMPVRDYVALAERVRGLTAEAGALLIINDRVDVALAVGADGVHLGQDDFPVPQARQLAPDLIIGASTHDVEEALRAQAEGASYINIGPLFSTGTKRWEGEFLGVEGLRRVAAVAHIPFTVMGGIKESHIPDLVRAGARTIALVTAVTAASDPEAAARGLLETIRASTLLSHRL
jgi:thiamine-phosphate pyrophosphorylase